MNTKERSRFFRFAVVGSIGAIIDFGVFNLLTNLVGFRALVSSIISFILAVSSNFLWNRYWTYPDSRSKHVVHQLVQFLVISVIGLIIRTPTFAFLEKILIQEVDRLSLNLPVSSVFIGHNLALAIVIILVMFWNFFANRFWTYADVQ
jgi:putative flippase GtrA